MSVLLDAAAGLFKGRNIARQQQYAEDQDTQARNDRIAQQQAAEADRQEGLQIQRDQARAQAGRQSAADAIALGERQKKNFEDGYDPLATVQTRGPAQAVSGLAAGIANPLAGNVVSQAGADQMNAQPSFTMDGQPMARGHMSVKEQETATAAHNKLLEATAEAAVKAAALKQSQDFTAGQNDKKINAAAALQGSKNAAGVSAAQGARLQDNFTNRQQSLYQNNPMVKRAQTRADILNQVLSVGALDNPISDYVLKTEIAKLADPLHIVTDQASQHIEALPSAPTRVKQLVSNLMNGKRLPPEMKGWIMDLAANEAANGARQVDPIMRNVGETLRNRGYEADSARVAPDPFEAIKTLPEVQKMLGRPGAAPAQHAAPVDGNSDPAYQAYLKQFQGKRP